MEQSSWSSKIVPSTFQIPSKHDAKIRYIWKGVVDWVAPLVLQSRSQQWRWRMSWRLHSEGQRNFSMDLVEFKPMTREAGNVDDSLAICFALCIFFDSVAMSISGSCI
jgi:hypothetical protein